LALFDLDGIFPLQAIHNALTFGLKRSLGFS